MTTRATLKGRDHTVNTSKSHKQTIDELAIFGGEPMFSRPLIVGRPNIPDVDSVVDDIREILLSERLSNGGPFVQRFEEEIRGIAGTDHCVVTCNATAALEMTARALTPKGEVIVPSFTFIATAHALSWLGITPVFVDVDPITHTIDPASVEAAITSSTTGICGVHLWGNVCDVEALQAIADRHGLALWFDAAHAFSVAGKCGQVGNFGRAEVFSFHATKFVNALEGGAIVTNDAQLAQTLREMTNFGFAENPDREVLQVGINAKMPEASAAVGLRALENLDDLRMTNRRNFSCYKKLLATCHGVLVKAPQDPENSNCQYVVIEVDESRAGISRDSMLAVLEAEGVLAKPYFRPGCHYAAPYREQYLKRGISLPVTEQLAQTVLVLPTGTAVSVEDIERACSLIQFATKFGGEISEKTKHRPV